MRKEYRGNPIPVPYQVESRMEDLLKRRDEKLPARPGVYIAAFIPQLLRKNQTGAFSDTAE
jgi:hypothetical protein